MLREVISNEWFTVLFLISLGILAFTKYSYSSRFDDFVALIGNSKYLKIYSRDQKFIDLFEALLFINLVITLSLFAFISYSTLVDPIEFMITDFMKIMLAIGAVLLIKVLIERLIGSLFEIDELIDTYLFQKTNYKNYTGLILLPINILLIFTLKPTSLLIIVVLGLIILLNLIGFFTSVRTHQKLVLGNLFYFILYLCALEFGPYIILYKVLS